MWHGPGQDPGGGPDSGASPDSSQELSDLKDQLGQQQVLIAQLKEMIRKSEQSSVTQEKVDEYMNTLSKRSAKARKTKREDDGGTKKTVDIPASQKISLLRQQVEENKARFAERGKNQKGIEEMVTQLKAQLDDSQQLINQTPLNLSLQDAKVEYSENSSAQELYVVLLTKEKKITDLISKVQKLESNVLDLQENVKEKDSVIDARTKAITLMTENLSKKGKSTLDALDETKEQMRKMQENFVSLEAEMKARQMKLLDDLRLKNYEIAELQEVNSSLNREIDDLKERITSRDDTDSAKIEEYKMTIRELNEKLEKKESENNDGEEINKLRKQLEESNKNMIKVKAQHKSKVKELTRKIEEFKKISDANAEIVKLEAEICRLNQKVAELEEEKGSLQLKLVDSDASKAPEDHMKLLEEKDKIISILEAEISRSKSEIDLLNERLNGQVSSQMTSIQFEEQMDSLENEKKKLIEENERTAKGKEELLETIEILTKEKQELSSKLEHYIQENMELVDKLEKLSAEKVSSAESIEIVESLTQQEKLELEAYQKNLDLVAGNLKSSEENLPQTVDLNESVNELTEETSELLQKIELFTVERREVMEKMEQLKQENGNLSLKIKEIENNRDILAETYEQLQNEKELLVSKLEAVEKENEDLKEKKEEIHHDDGLDKQVEELKEELNNYKSLIENKKEELALKEKEINQLNNNVIDLNRTLADYENENKSLSIKVSQLEEHKTNLDRLIEKNQEELEVISNTEWENRRLLESKDNEITKLMKERDNTESVILDLQKVIREKDEKFHKISSDLKEKYLNLQKQLEENSGNLQNITGPLEIKIEELTAKNKEQLEKMKKIAANLKKKNHEYQHLEDKLKETQEKHQEEIKTMLQQLQDLEEQYNLKTEEIKILEENNVQLQNVIADLKVKVEKSNEISLEQELLLTRENLGSIESSLRAKIQELEMILETRESELKKSRERVNKLEEGISFVEERRLSLERKANELGARLEEKSMTCEEVIRSEDLLEQRLAALTAHDEAIEKKLEEAIVENQDLTQQNKKLIEKNDKLKKKLEQVVEKMKKMENQQNAVEEMEVQNEEMKRHVAALQNEAANYLKIIEENRNDFDRLNGDWQNQFDEILKEKNELMTRCEIFEEELRQITEKELNFNDELVEYKTKLEKSEEEIRNYEDQIQKMTVLSEELENLKKLVEEKDVEINSYQQQMQKLSHLEEVKKKIEEKDVEIGNYQKQVQQNLSDLEELNKKIEEKDSEIVNYQEHLEVLKKKIEEKDEEISNYQKQNLQLQTEASSASSFFDSPAIQQNDELIARLQEELDASRRQTGKLRRKIEDLEAKKTETEVQITETQQQQEIPTFVWSGQSSDPFDFIQETKIEAPQAQKPPEVQNDQRELQEKMKTLQFMVFNAEKEKEEALMQCEQLTNELTRLVYEKQLPDLESQILPQNDTADAPEEDLRKIEFEETEPPRVSSLESGPVAEEPMRAKEAYLCFGEDAKNTLESQVLSEAETADTLESRGELRRLEFEESRPSVKEEACGTKDAYLCYTFGENDDGWGWGPEEGKLEEEHANAPLKLREKIRVLEMERENHLEEIRQLQVKSGKLIKKLKEFKQKNEELSQTRKKSSDGELFNLDDTIQEELKLQIQQAEKKLRETAADLEKEKNEKSAILKKVEALTAANERMVEMKEKQDVELLGWQRNCRELSEKLERFEWGDDGFASSESPKKEKVTEESGNLKIQELNEIIKDLTLDNEELQSLLEEQRTLRMNAEKSKEPVAEYTKTEEEYTEVVNQLRLSGEEKKQLQDQVNELIKKNSELVEKFEFVERQNDELTTLTSSKDEVIERLNENLRLKEVAEVEGRNFLGKIEELTEEKEVLFEELQTKNAQIVELRESLEKQISSLGAELESQRKSAQAVLEENKKLIETVTDKDAELKRLTVTLEQMRQEWEIRVDQRGNDVAESWKLHLESRETEFAQIERLLRKEINELEEKTNALVNENNELRKNVDAEIRNEVDRVAALQQQINDRQQYINDLTRVLQEKQGEVENLQREISKKNEELEVVGRKLEEEKKIVDSVLNMFENDGGVVEHDVNSVTKVVKETLAKHEEEMTVLNERHESVVEEKDQTIDTLTSRLQEVQNLKDYESENVQNLQQNVFEYQQYLENYQQQVNSQIQGEILNLKRSLEEKEKEHDHALEHLSQEYQTTINENIREMQTLKKRLQDNENRYEELLADKDSDLEGIRFELKTKNEEIQDLSSRLSANIEECTKLQKTIEEKNALIEEDDKQLTELKAIIEDQVLKIEELKQELYHKSNDYDSLVAEMDISKSSSSKSENQPSKSRIEDEDLTEPVSRAELDLALYMLHQRDVRCEELTVELTQLLEERDTLQLRLSNVIREKEELGRKMAKEEVSEEKASASSSNVVAKIEEEPRDSLTAKLSELKIVGYKKDKTIVDEQDLRRLQQLSIMQQHRDVASKLPPEAAARLVDASYTLSRDVQSPSKVLLNWLWGRSTPKVNNV